MKLLKSLKRRNSIKQVYTDLRSNSKFVAGHVIGWDVLYPNYIDDVYSDNGTFSIINLVGQTTKILPFKKTLGL